ncbi:MAG: chaperone modulator CbpM [Flavobacteriales bacterium]
MKTISVQQFCEFHQVPKNFIDSLSNYDLIKIIEIESHQHINIEDINKIEKLKRIHYDLQVNMEGLDVIQHLLNEIETLQNNIKYLKNRIDFYE